MKTSGVVPFIRVMDSLTLAISQGSLRRGSAAVYLPISHPEIEEFVELGVPREKLRLASRRLERAVPGDVRRPALNRRRHLHLFR